MADPQVQNNNNLSYADWMMFAKLQQAQRADAQNVARNEGLTTNEELTNAISGHKAAPSKSKTEDGSDDGSIGFFGAIKHIAKGAGKFVTGMFTDKDGKFSIGQTLKTVAIGAGIAAITVLTAGTAVPALIAGAGVVMAGTGLAKSAYNVATANTDADAEQAWEGIGSNGVALAASVVGAKAAMKSYNAANGIEADYSGFKGTFEALKDTGKLTKNVTVDGVNGIKDAYKAGGVDGLKSFAQEKYVSSKEIMSNNWEKATKPSLARENTQKQDLEKVDSQIKQAQDDLGKTTVGSDEHVAAQTKLDKLQEHRVSIDETYNKFNQMESLEDANKQIEQYESGINEAKSKLAQATDDAVKEDLKTDIANREKQLEVAKNVTKSKTNEIRETRSEIDRIDKQIEKRTKDGKDVTTLTEQKAKLQEKLDNNGFNIPGKTQNKTFAQAHSESVKAAIQKQQQYSAKHREVANLEAKLKTADPVDKPALQAELDAAKAEEQTLLAELNKSRQELGSAQRMLVTSTNRGRVSSFADNYINGVKSTYGNEYDINIPFTKYTVPGVVASPGSYAAVFGGSEFEENVSEDPTLYAQAQDQTQTQNPFNQLTPEQQAMIQQYATGI